MAQFPLSVKNWSPTDSNYPVDLEEIVYAIHVTSIYDEVMAIETELGTGSGGLKTSVVENANTVVTASTTFGSLKSRLANIEQGMLDGVNRRVKTNGGSTITSASSTVGLSVTTTGTGNLLEIRNTSNTLVNYFDKDGVFHGTIDCGTF